MTTTPTAEHNATTDKPTDKPKKWQSIAGHNRTAVMGVGGLLIAAVIGFAGGVVFERGAQRMADAPPFMHRGFTQYGDSLGPNDRSYARPGIANGMREQMGRQSRQTGIVGAVSSISDQSITVNDTRTNTTVTLNITNDTTVTKQGVAAKASDIKPGSRVMVRTSTGSANTATTIDITE
jgi:hypothetical protein